MTLKQIMKPVNLRCPSSRPMLALCTLIFASTLSFTAQASERTTSYTYNSLGLISSTDGPRSDVSDITTYDYDLDTGRLLSTTNALGHTVTLSDFDANNRPQTVTDANGLVTRLSYNWQGKILTRTIEGPEGDLTTTYTYNGYGALTRVTAPNGATVSYHYDDAHRLIAISNAHGERIDYTLDAAGNVLSTQIHDASGTLVRQHQQAFDELSRLRQSIGGTDQQTTQYGYDANDNNTRITDPKQNPDTTQQFDALNRLTQITDSAGGITYFSYDSQDRITSVTDPRGLVTRYQYNGFGDLTTLTSPDTGTTTFAYDDAGNLIQKTDAHGTVTQYTYDALNRPTHIQTSGETNQHLYYSYDVANYNGIGRLYMMRQDPVRLYYRYNSLGQVTRQTVRMYDADNHYTERHTHYAYNAQGQLTRLTYPTGTVLNYEYNDQGQLQHITWQANQNAVAQPLIRDLTYLPFGPATGFTYGNGIQQSYTYDLDYRLTDLSSRVQDWVYHYDLNSNIEQIQNLTDSTLDQSFSYDGLNRLIDANGPYGDYQYRYDAVGNRTERLINQSSQLTTETYTYAEQANQLLKVDSTTTDSSANSTHSDSRNFQYSESGQLLQDQNNTRTLNLVYGNDQRLQHIDNSDTGVQADYTYNPQGQRVRKILTDNTGTVVSTTLYHYDLAGHLIAETDENGTPIREYLYLGEQAIAMKVSGNRLYYVHNDHLNTPRILTDQDQNKVWEIQTTPFGEISEEITTGITQLKGFPGQMRDPETGYSDNWNRTYDPSIGRYLQSDPIGLGGGLNTYGYVNGNPLSYVDPNGLRGAFGQATATYYDIMTGGAAANGHGGISGYGSQYDLYFDQNRLPTTHHGSNSSSSSSTNSAPEFLTEPNWSIAGDSDATSKAIERAREKQRQKERIAAHRQVHQICDNVPNVTDPCEFAKANLKRWQSCLNIRQSYRDLIGGEYDEQINQVKRNIEKAKEAVRENCGHEPDCQ
ncbi:RHS repeat-associated core domain-containing protein [Gynuella sunshinyii]|uniref:Rhs family protein n=1 Tax=Gynuella sunshinyii YC6258 TaxID=1445510 RepID=A0A0C5VLV9_9GAMM|nr:RHS repeat-associated core domain-containing protein [Gynuella sunshinyii]AJQ94338.1 rhs family protein [Gynuella sunshinyii YC6258]